MNILSTQGTVVRAAGTSSTAPCSAGGRHCCELRPTGETAATSIHCPAAPRRSRAGRCSRRAPAPGTGLRGPGMVAIRHRRDTPHRPGDRCGRRDQPWSAGDEGGGRHRPGFRRHCGGGRRSDDPAALSVAPDRCLCTAEPPGLGYHAAPRRLTGLAASVRTTIAMALKVWPPMTGRTFSASETPRHAVPAVQGNAAKGTFRACAAGVDRHESAGSTIEPLYWCRLRNRQLPRSIAATIGDNSKKRRAAATLARLRRRLAGRLRRRSPRR